MAAFECLFDILDISEDQVDFFEASALGFGIYEVEDSSAECVR